MKFLTRNSIKLIEKHNINNNKKFWLKIIINSLK